MEEDTEERNQGKGVPGLPTAVAIRPQLRMAKTVAARCFRLLSGHAVPRGEVRLGG